MIMPTIPISEIPQTSLIEVPAKICYYYEITPDYTTFILLNIAFLLLLRLFTNPKIAATIQQKMKLVPSEYVRSGIKVLFYYNILLLIIHLLKWGGFLGQ